MTRPITLVCGDYDRTRRLLDGTIGLDGYRIEATTLPAEEMFGRVLNEAVFDITELSASIFLSQLSTGTCQYIGVPAFPSRAFRHGAIYIRSDSAISRPQDLQGKTIGVRSYLNTAALVVRGILQEEFGVAARDIRWRLGDVDEPERKTIPLPKLSGSFDIDALPYGTTLSAALLSGSIDAIVHYVPPRGFGAGDAPVKRLFDRFVDVEREYFRKTGIFPIMHLIGVRRSLLQDDPRLAKKIYDAFCQAKNFAMEDLNTISAPKISLPWPQDDMHRAMALLGTDYWPYGIAANKAAIASLIRYAMDQGVIDRPLHLGDLFDQYVLNT